MSRWIDRYGVRPWARPMSPLALGFCRISLGAFLLYYVFTTWTSLPGLHDQPASAWEPYGAAVFLPRPPTPVEAQVLLGLTAVSGVLFTVGLRWRIAAPVFLISSILVLSLRCSWGVLFHHLHLCGLHALIFAVAASAGSPSVDAGFGGVCPTGSSGPRWIPPATPARAGRCGWRQP